MITILVDEAYAFDYLSILVVKKSDLYNTIYEHLSSQIKSFDLILDSEEYKNMIKANQLVFDCVDRARYGSISAKELDDANMQRHYAKQQLQLKFFNNSLTELKT